MASKTIDLELPDRSSMRAYVSAPGGSGPFPALIVFQEAFGVNRHIRDVADRFAGEGFVAMAPELFHRSAPPGFEGPYSDFNAIMPHMQALTEAGMETDIRGCWDWLQKHPDVRKGEIGCTGYCLGGRVSFLANAILPFRAAVSYYGGRIVPDLVKRASNLHAPMLFFWGGLDKHIPPEQTAAVSDALRKTGKPFTVVEFSFADHGFFCDQRPSHNAAASRQAWALTLAFLREQLGAGG